MLDFTSALYLGLQHSSQSLRPWKQLTAGKPAALAAPVQEQRLGQWLASHIGCERAVLGTSTLHLFWDVFGVLAQDDIAVYMDTGTYPVAQWGIERAAARGVPVRPFAHHDAAALKRGLQRDVGRWLRPIVVADGFCPGCGRPAPIADYLDCIRGSRGYLVLDDTQALGILGHSPGTKAPYGKGGGGSLRWGKVYGSNIIVVSSLAKGFGVPVAVMAGSHAWVKRFEAQSEIRVHCSPPSSAVFHAVEHALAVNREHGNALRFRLAHLIRWFQKRLASCGLATTGGLFPMQTLRLRPDLDVRLVHKRLLDLKIRSVLHRPRCKRRAAISFLITTLHRSAHIERAARAVSEVVRHARAYTRKRLEMHHERFELGFGTV